MATPKVVRPTLPPPAEQMVDDSGHVTTNWFLWLKMLDTFMRDHEIRIAALEP